MDIENQIQQFIIHFVSPLKQERWSAFLKSEKNRTKITRTLHHCNDFINLTQIPSNEQTQEKILELLKKCGAGKFCYALSTQSDLDGQTMDLSDALDKMNAGSHLFPTVLLCGSGKLAYYEGEDAKSSWLLKF